MWISSGAGLALDVGWPRAAEARHHEIDRALDELGVKRWAGFDLGSDLSRDAEPFDQTIDKKKNNLKTTKIKNKKNK